MPRTGPGRVLVSYLDPDVRDTTWESLSNSPPHCMASERLSKPHMRSTSFALTAAGRAFPGALDTSPEGLEERAHERRYIPWSPALSSPGFPPMMDVGNRHCRWTSGVENLPSILPPWVPSSAQAKQNHTIYVSTPNGMFIHPKSKIVQNLY